MLLLLLHIFFLFSFRFASEGIMNPATGRDYREMILRPGKGSDPKKNPFRFSFYLGFYDIFIFYRSNSGWWCYAP